jgi:hypothetical protein
VTWALRIPYQHRDESLIDTASHARHLPAGDDRDIARQIIFKAMERGARTAADLLDELAAMEPGERRALMDQARVAVGLPDTDTIEARQRVHGINRVELVQGLQRCHAPDCDAVPTTPAGSWALVNVARWHCPAHAHLAGPGDMTDAGCGVRYSEHGVLVPDEPGADARAASEAESRRAQQRAQQADRDRDAAAYAEHRAAQAEQLRAELPEHLQSTV